MTAEVAVMNRNGVALAADSAVTVLGRMPKIYDSADKLFQLSNHAPVGVMVYGATSLLQVPWETLVKMYRRELADHLFPSLRGYADDFMRFLKSRKEFFPKQDQSDLVNAFFKSYFQNIVERYRNTVDTVIEEHGPVTEAEARRVFRDLVGQELRSVRKFPRLDGLPRDICSRMVKTYGKEMEAAREAVFGDFGLRSPTKEKLGRLGAEVLTRVVLERGVTPRGVVVAGFGERELYPSVVERHLFGVILGYPFQYECNAVQVGAKVDACVSPFAQQEMVRTFIEGIDPDLKRFLEESVEELMPKVADVFVELLKSKSRAYGEKVGSRIASSLTHLASELKKGWDEEREANYTRVVMEMVGSLPKSELAAMAESLVNLTKFKRRVSMQKETVGGAIDVAVITKGDGFVWVKRKHYFPAELNPRFFGRYH